MNETLQTINLILGVIITCVATGGALAKLGAGSSGSAFQNQAITQNIFSSLSLAKPRSHIWAIDWQRIAAMLLGAIIDFALQYVIFRLNYFAVGPFWVLSFPIVVVLFFGVVFGPWAGLFAGVVGDILSFKVINSFIPFPPTFVVGDAILGFLAGLSLAYTQGRFDNPRTILRVEIIAGCGIIIGDLYNSITFQQPFLSVVLQDLITGLVLFTVILILYNKSISYES
ncbi:MAG TPA: ECF transporter S component [Ktedonobacteraceae bacterium]|nr:ECF transporter S component [Ktedonobacteraceae bacterium]